MPATTKTEMDVELLLRWAYRDELSKRQLSSAEGIWDRIQEDGQRGGIDPGHGAAQRYAHFGLPDADAERIEKAVGALEDTIIDWDQSFDAIAADLSALISVNQVARRDPTNPKQPKAGWGARGARAVEAWWGEGAAEPVRQSQRDVPMVGGLRTAALVTMHAIKGTRPDWIDDDLKPEPTPATTGANAMVVGNCEGKNRYSLGSYCPLKWSPSPMSIVSSRAEYVAWHAGLGQLAVRLRLEKFNVLPPTVSGTPWFDGEIAEKSRVVPVMPTASNDVRTWGTLPLSPVRDRRYAGPVRLRRASEVRYPLVVDVQ